MSTPGVRFDKSAQFGPGQIGVDPAAEAAIRASHVDLQLSDWGSVSARRAKNRPDQGGWNLFHTSANGAQLASPLVSPSTIMTCDGKNFVGWPCDKQEEDLRQQYIQETDPETQKALVEAMHRRLWEVIPYVPLGQLKQPFLWRKNISGVLKANTLVFWNIEKI